jgi:hypothetical protein
MRSTGKRTACSHVPATRYRPLPAVCACKKCVKKQSTDDASAPCGNFLFCKEPWNKSVEYWGKLAAYAH